MDLATGQPTSTHNLSFLPRQPCDVQHSQCLDGIFPQKCFNIGRQGQRAGSLQQSIAYVRTLALAIAQTWLKGTYRCGGNSQTIACPFSSLDVPPSPRLP